MIERGKERKRKREERREENDNLDSSLPCERVVHRKQQAPV